MKNSKLFQVLFRGVGASRGLLILGCGSLLVACGSSDEPERNDGTPVRTAALTRPAPPECAPLDTDYAPGADDMYAACIADDVEDGDAYPRIEETISTIARVEAFEELVPLIFRPDADPSADDFLEARMIYQRDEGLDSRMARRYDPHYESQGVNCEDEGGPEANPDYCVGPAFLQPTVLDAFQAAVTGSTPDVPSRVYGARIEAMLLWFLYASVHKESLTCTEKPKDCDSSYAYYTGGSDAREGIGLARYVNEVDPAAHDRAWDGLLAVRCWRDLDDADAAEDTETRDRARDQYDRAVLDGVAAIVRDRLIRYRDADDDGVRSYYAEFITSLGPVLLLESGFRDAALAEELRSTFESVQSGDVDVDAAVQAIDTLFDCP